MGSYQLLEDSAQETRNSSLSARTVVQQCTHALLQVKPDTADADSEWVEVYLFFFYSLCPFLNIKLPHTLLHIKVVDDMMG